MKSIPTPGIRVALLCCCLPANFCAATGAWAADGAPPATVVDASAEGGPTLSEITVTAQKRKTDLQKTPISISVLNGNDLSNRHALTLTDLGDGSIPSLRVAPFFARKSALTLGIRGVGALGDANQPARDQGVGVYLDGVYLGRAQGLGAALYDVERIEVLKGPQGTLFGRNTEGGAISIVTKKPSGEFHASMTAGASNYGGYEGIAHVDLPRVHDISIKVDALVQGRGGTIDNPLSVARDFNNYHRKGLHIAALWEPAPNVSATYSFDISRDASTPYYVQLIKTGSLKLAPLIHLQPDRADIANVGVPMQDSVGKTWGHQLNLEWKPADRLTIRSISSYRHLTQSQYDSGEQVISVFAPNGNFNRYSLANFYQHQYSEELQVLGDLPRLNFVGGAFYHHEQVRDNAWTPNTDRWNADGTGYIILPVPIAATPFPDRASHAKTESSAAFGQATYTPPLLNDMAHLTLGGRYSHDRKSGDLYLVNGAVPVVNGVPAVQTFALSKGRFDPLINLSLDLARSISVYGKWSTGYKSGGANSRSLTYRAFGPESISEFEVGAKTEFLDHHVRLNLAAYTGKYKNVQVDFNAIIPGANRGTLETTNTDGAGRIKGVEADLTIAPVTGLTLTGSYAYNQVRLPEAPNPFVTGNPLVVVYPLYAPRNAASGAIDYSLPLNGATLSVHLDANYADGQYTSSTDPSKSQKSFLVNGRISAGEMHMAGTGATLEVSLWSRNLLDKSYIFLKNFNSSLGTYAIFNEPRTFGASATVRY
jgi:iron complex outermembrane receptor protein